jgi:hypothetical protein
MGPSPTVIPLNTATIVGGTGVVDEVVGHWGHRMCLSDFGVVLITESPLGLRVRRATWGTGSGSTFREEISEGER